MQEITIVRRRTRIWPILIALLVLALIVLAVLWLMGSQPVTDVSRNELIELGRRSTSGIT
jgi:peptidoglycan/LPS O-acetylase OafA/YrhL